MHAQASGTTRGVHPTKRPAAGVAAHRQDSSRRRRSRRWNVRIADAKQCQRLDAESRSTGRDRHSAIKENPIVVERDARQAVSDGSTGTLLPDVSRGADRRDAHQGAVGVRKIVKINVASDDKRNVAAVVCKLINVDLADQFGAVVGGHCAGERRVGNADDALQIGQCVVAKHCHVWFDGKAVFRGVDCQRKRRLLRFGQVGKTQKQNPKREQQRQPHLKEKRNIYKYKIKYKVLKKKSIEKHTFLEVTL